jgi:predicted N-acetyltransferase YhbS
MPIEIRSEQTQDYFGIAEVQLLAFGNQYGIPLIVAMRRQFASFDPELSIAAIQDGKVVGHVVFSPYDIRVLDTTVKSVNLSPLAVHPDYQRTGVGGQLVEAGHRMVKEKGYVLSTVLGHPPYYPRFGYQIKAYGASEVTVTASEGTQQMLEMRVPITQDIESLQALWWQAEGAVDFALIPEPTLLEWLSPNPLIDCTVYLRDGQVIGYARILRSTPLHVRTFLAADDEAARAMVGSICSHYQVDSVKLPLHPFSAGANAFDQKPVSVGWDAGMAVSLAPNPFDEYFAQVQAGSRPAGRAIWPPPFDLA